MTDKCVVPNCKNPTSVGISTSPEPEWRERGPETSQTNVQSDSTYFVCLDHLDEKKPLNHVSDGNPEEAPQTSPRPVPKGENEKSCSQICRLCVGANNVTIPALASWFDTLDVATIIAKCIPEIKIMPEDPLSRVICVSCWETVKKFYAFRSNCLEADAKQKELLRNSQKRNVEKEETCNPKSKRAKSDEPPEESQDNKSSIDIKFRQIEKELMETFDGDVVENVTRAPNDLENRESVSQQLTSDCEDPDRPVEAKKLNQVELELMKVIEGKLTEEMKSAENIIIEVQSDEEAEDGGECSKNLQEKAGGRVGNVVRIGSNELKLPKSIRVTAPSKYQSELGSFPSQPVQKILDSEFCSVDNYLFEIGLCKGNIRHLRCLAPKCGATARQNLYKPPNSKDSITMRSAHNHRPPNQFESKRHILCHVMRRKMQTDKTLNFRAVYDEFCAKDPEIKDLVPLKSVINQVCCQQLALKHPPIRSFEEFYEAIEDDGFEKLHFTHTNVQWYQERFTAGDGAKAVVFGNRDAIQQVCDSKIMYVDASFQIDTKEPFSYQLVTILVWVDDSYYPILFALVNERSQEIYKQLFQYLRDTLAPSLRPDEIVTDYEACLYYALGETYLDSHIGGSVFYYTQNLYKKICSLNLSRELETNSYFRNIYHMILMLPLLPVNTILDGLKNIELQASELGLEERTRPIFAHVRSEWMEKVTPELFCVHRLENRINENVIAPFKKLRDFLMLSKGKLQKSPITIVSVVEKLIELEGFLQVMYSAPSKKSFARDLSSSQKKNVIRAWQFIESHPKININNFFTKVLGYIKCMENQLWIWGFYRHEGDTTDDLINAANFSIVNTAEGDEAEQCEYVYPVEEDVVMDVVIDENDGFLVKEAEGEGPAEIVKAGPFQSAYVDYVAKD